MTFERKTAKTVVTYSLLIALLLAVLLVWWPGCREYPVVTSPESMELIKLVYVGCNTKDIKIVKSAESKLDTLRSKGGVSPSELLAFRKITDMAHREKWQEAERAALQFARDQVGRGR